jgi:hypothetical protein
LEEDQLMAATAHPIDTTAFAPGSAAPQTQAPTVVTNSVIAAAVTIAPADATISAPGTISLANRSAVTLVLGGPAGSTVTYRLSDGVHSVGDTITIGDSGTATVVVDATALADGALTATASFVDRNGYTASASVAAFKDTTPPVVTVALAAAPTSNGGAYDVGATIGLSFGGSDLTSATLDGATISSGGAIDVDTLLAGAHTIVVTGIDAAGNTTTKTITFQVHATLNGLLAAANDGAKKGLVTSAELATLTSLLQAAMKGNSGRIKLPAFISEVQKAAGKSIAAGYAALLLNWAQDLLPRL